MGLDMYAYRTSREIGDVDFFTETRTSEGDEEIAYWRKHPNTHGWMEKLYRSKGGTSEDFNIDPVKLTAEDLDAFEKAVNAGELPETSGFFFGQSHPDDKANDLEFVRVARQALEEGDSVYYYAWW